MFTAANTDGERENLLIFGKCTSPWQEGKHTSIAKLEKTFVVPLYYSISKFLTGLFIIIASRFIVKINNSLAYIRSRI